MMQSAPMPILPDRVDVLRLCQQREALQGKVPLASLPRLVQQLAATEPGDAVARWQFGIDEQGRKLLQATVNASLPVQCQRCLGTVMIPVSASVDLVAVWDDTQAAQLPRRLEPVLMDGHELSLHTLVEEELLLALPLVPSHQVGECQMPDLAVVETEPGQDKARNNPFQVLAALKTVEKGSENT